MNLQTKLPKAQVKARNLSDWLLSHGISSVTTGEIANLLGVPTNQVSARLAAPRRRKEIISPAKGLFIPVPAEFRTWGAPPALEIIDLMMSHLDVPYYVGWLSAAALLGASHHAPQVFQVATQSHIRWRSIGRSDIQFYSRENVERLPIDLRQTRSGSARVSTTATTLLDVTNDCAIVGGLDNAANIVIELCETDTAFLPELLGIASLYPASANRRLGWIMENFTELNGLEDLRRIATTRVGSPSKIDPTRSLVGDFDTRWNIYINRKVEPDV
jgi:predicted transcriptional regulator of viral defense system